MKLHIGCGSVYLKDWVNMDVASPQTFLAKQRPDLVEKWITTEDNYYGRHEDKTAEKLRKGPLQQAYVCDVFGDLSNIPAQYWETDEVLIRQCFEHLSIREAHQALDQLDGILKPNGILRIDVPDHDATLRLFQETGDSFYIRHLLGPRRDDRGYHLMSYDKDRLRSLVEEHGFLFVEEEENIHFYPAFCLKFVKPGPRAPRDYVKLPEIPKNARVLDVGPGQLPLPRADFYLDKTIDNLKPLQELGKGTIIGDLEKGLPNVETKSFDYVWASHVLEHVEDPAYAAHTLSRIAKRGTLVVPSTFKEMMFHGEEGEHLWQCLANPKPGGPPIFIRNNEQYMHDLRDSEVQRITSRLYRTGPNRLAESRYLRKWFYQKEESLDIVHHWDGSLNVVVIR